MDVAITRMSSNGQVVIPTEMRMGFQEGDKLLLIQTDGQLIMKKASTLDKTLKADLDFAKRTEAAWKSYEKGKFKSMNSKDFLDELAKW